MEIPLFLPFKAPFFESPTQPEKPLLSKKIMFAAIRSMHKNLQLYQELLHGDAVNKFLSNTCISCILDNLIDEESDSKYVRHCSHVLKHDLRNSNSRDYLANIITQTYSKLKLLFSSLDDYKMESLSHNMTTNILELMTTHKASLKTMRILHHLSSIYLILTLRDTEKLMVYNKYIEIINLISVIMSLDSQFDFIPPDMFLDIKTNMKYIRFVAQLYVRSGLVYESFKLLSMENEELNIIHKLLMIFLQFVSVNEVLHCYSTLSDTSAARYAIPPPPKKAPLPPSETTTKATAPK